MGMPQWLAHLDHAFPPFRLERLFRETQDLPFPRLVPRCSAGYVREMLLEISQAPDQYIERKGVEAVVRGHVQGDIRNYTTELHKVMTLELLHRLFLDNPQTGDSGGHRLVEPCRMESPYSYSA